MGYDDFRTKPRVSRPITVLAILIVALLLGSGVFLASNYKYIGNLVKVVTLIRAQYLYPVDSSQLADGAVKGLVDSLDDPYSIYLEPQTFAQLKEQIKGTFGGLGILVGIKEGYITVVRSYQGTPAARAGMMAGDIISKIDDRDARGLDLETAINLMRGPVGSKVTLTVDRQGETRQFPLTREEISVPTVEGQVLANTGVGYIVLSQFTERTADELRDVLSRLQNEYVKGIVLDLRDNPGGELLAAVNVAKIFIPKGPIVYVDFRVGRDQSFHSEGRSTIQIPLVVLTNGGSASAAEILAGAVKDRGAGTLVGTKTFGKGVVQTVFPLSNGAGLKLTTARYLTPSKNDINEKGIEPDIIVESSGDRSRDVQLERAVEILKQQMSG